MPLIMEMASKTGSVVDLVNIALFESHFAVPGVSACQASKFAVNRLFEFIQAEYADNGINCYLTELSKYQPPITLASLALSI